MKNKGFTLIELMIVVAIIAIIAAIAIPSLLRSRMAANQTAAAAACKAFAEAEEIYRRTDYDTDGVLEYAQRLSGANSLLEKIAGSGDLALIDRSFGAAEGDPAAASPPSPKAGYCFTVLTRQGLAATGGVRIYLTTGGSRAEQNMTLGYACGAAPGAYDGTGRDQYMINGNGTIFQADTGDNVAQTVFNPTPGTWIPSE